MERSYTGLIRKRDDTDFWIDFPDITGCAVAAADMDTLQAKAPPVLQSHIDALVAAGIALPPPRSPHDIAMAEAYPYIATLSVSVAVPERALRNNVRLFPHHPPSSRPS